VELCWTPKSPPNTANSGIQGRFSPKVCEVFFFELSGINCVPGLSSSSPLSIYALPLLALHHTQLDLIELATDSQSHTHSTSSPTPPLPLLSILEWAQVGFSPSPHRALPDSSPLDQSCVLSYRHHIPVLYSSKDEE